MRSQSLHRSLRLSSRYVRLPDLTAPPAEGPTLSGVADLLRTHIGAARGLGGHIGHDDYQRFAEALHRYCFGNGWFAPGFDHAGRRAFIRVANLYTNQSPATDPADVGTIITMVCNAEAPISRPSFAAHDRFNRLFATGRCA